MDKTTKPITLVISVTLQDAGEATRSLEIAKGIRSMAPDGFLIRFVFFSHGSKFDKTVLDNGFEIHYVKPTMEGYGYLTDLKPTKTNFIGDPYHAIQLLKGELEALRICRPDLILYGFWPIAGLARRMISPIIPGICFLPLPLEPSIYGSYLMKDIPDQIKPLTYLPISLRRKIIHAIPTSMILKAPILQQTNLLHAAKECGWTKEPLTNLFDLLKSDLTIVNDFAGYYKEVPLPSNIVVTGPLYSQPEAKQVVDSSIKTIFHKNNENQINLFCSMGSSAKKELLLEAVKAIAALPADKFHAVILVPNSICSLSLVTPLTRKHKNIYVTSQFVPALLVNALADITICHGGQGTIQTAFVSGTPIIGFAMQLEQQINLDHIVLWGAGIRLPITRWKKKNITSAIYKLMSNNEYKKRAVELGNILSGIDGQTKTAQAIWKFIKRISKKSGR